MNEAGWEKKRQIKENRNKLKQGGKWNEIIQNVKN
jgi:hypothetical protein